MNRLLCLDIHGVCCDFVGGFLRWHEIPMTVEEWPKGVYDLEKATGHKLGDLPQEFWETLQPTEDFEALTSCIERRGIIACSLVFNREGAFGTYAWYLKHFDKIPFMPVTSFKGNYFSHEVLLIDDNEEEIAAWPGPSILIPRPWNNATGDPVEVLKRRLIEVEREDVDLGYIGNNLMVPRGAATKP